jgi:LPS-assembly protein
VNALAALAISGVLAQIPPAFAPTGDASVDAGKISYDLGTGRYVLEGGVVIRRGAVALRAGHARYDPVTGEVDAAGGVLLTDPVRAVAAEAVHAVLGGAFEATEVVAFLKDEAVALGDAPTVEVARRLGRNRLSFRGAKVVASPDGRLRVEGARVTLCDCGLDRAPSWLVQAREADVIAGKRAILRGAVIYVTPRFLGVDRPVPVLPVPYLYLPLGDRQTGVLLPEFRSTASTGPAFALPVFFTLGRSADLTVTPTYAFGSYPFGISDPGSVRGPGADLELRWAPWLGTLGRLGLRYVQDLEGDSGASGAGAGGARLALTGEHVQRVSERTRLRVDLSLFDDPFQISEFRNDILLSAVDYTRSSALVEHRRRDAVLALDTSYLLVMRPDPALAAEFGRFGSDLPTLHRWPSVQAELLPVAVAGPLRLAARGGASRWAPLEGAAAAPRVATDRLDGRAELSAPILAGDAFVLSPFVRGAAVARFADGRDDSTSAWGVGGLAISTEVARRTGAWRHAVAPRIEWRAGSGVKGDLPDAPALDGWDVASPPTPEAPQLVSALPGGAFQQLRIAVANRLTLGGASILELEVGQDLDLRRGTLAELWATGVVAAGPVAARGSLRGLPFDSRPGGTPAHPFDSPLDGFTQLDLEARVANRRGDFLRAGLISLGPGASGSLVAGAEPLFDLRPVPGDRGEPIAQGSFGGQLRVGGATLGYHALVPGRRTLAGACHDDGLTQVVIAPLEVQQHTGTFGWDSPCRCFRLALTLQVDRCGKMGGGATLDLSALGTRLFGDAGGVNAARTGSTP